MVSTPQDRLCERVPSVLMCICAEPKQNVGSLFQLTRGGVLQDVDWACSQVGESQVALACTFFIVIIFTAQAQACQRASRANTSTRIVLKFVMFDMGTGVPG